MQIEIQKNEIKPIVWNYESLKKELDLRLEKFRGVVVTAEDLTHYKEEKAKLNNLAKAINDKKIEVKKEIGAPLLRFDEEVKTLTSAIAEVVSEYNEKITCIEQKKKDEKKKDIEKYFNETNQCEHYKFSMVFNDRWLNTTVTMKAVKSEIDSAINKVIDDIETIKGLSSEFEVQLLDLYLKDFRLAAVLNEKSRLERLKKEVEEAKARKAAAANNPEVSPVIVETVKQEPVKQEPIKDIQTSATDEPLQQIDFRVWVTQEQKLLIRDFLESLQIKYGKVS